MLTISCFTLSIAVFEEGTFQQSTSFPQATLAAFMKFVRIGMPKRIPLPLLQNYYPIYWEMQSSKQVSFIHIGLFSRIFCKNRKCPRWYKTGAVKTRKAKNVAGNENKVILFGKCFENYMKWWLLLKHCLGPKAAGTTFKSQ